MERYPPMKISSVLIVVCFVFGGATIQVMSFGVPFDDVTPPVTTISFDPPTPTGGNGWYVSAVTVTLNATDNESGVCRTFCSLSPGGNYTGPLVVSLDGIYEITFYSVDYAGNVEGMKSAVLKIDQAPPMIEVDLTMEKVGSVYNIIINVTCLDLMSGMAKGESYFNGELQQTVAGPGPSFVWTFQYTPLPSFTIKVMMYDIAGNRYVVTITFGPRTFFAGVITDLDDTGGGIVSFKAQFVCFMVFHPLGMGRVTPDEEILIIREFQGYIGPWFIFGFFPIISIDYS